MYDRIDTVPDSTLYGISVYIGGRTPVGTRAVGVGNATGAWPLKSSIISTRTTTAMPIGLWANNEVGKDIIANTPEVVVRSASPAVYTTS